MFIITGRPALNVVPQSRQTLVEGADLGVAEVLGAAAAVAMAVAAVAHLGLKRLALATGPAPTVTTYVLPASKPVCASTSCLQKCTSVCCCLFSSSRKLCKLAA